MKKEIRKKSVMPVYAVAIVFALWALFLPLYALWHFLLLIAASGAAYFAARAFFPGEVTVVELPPEPVETGDTRVDALLREGETAVAEMRQLQKSAPAAAVQTKIEAIAEVTDKIFKDVLEDPADYAQIRRFADFFLPTTLKLLYAYDRFSDTELVGGNRAGTRARIEDALDAILHSYRKQYDALFQNQALDIETDIIVLENMLKKEGLLSGLDGGAELGGK